MLSEGRIVADDPPCVIDSAGSSQSFVMAKVEDAVIPADAVGRRASSGSVAAVDGWIRGVIAQHHPALGRVVCPFVAPALERGTLFYAPVAGCHSPEDVLSVMEELIERFVALPPLTGADSQLRTLVAVFVDVDSRDAARIVIAAHHDLKNRCTARGLMVGEFAPGYRLPSTRNAAVNVGEAPAPVLALRHMLPSDRRFLQGEDQWLAAWAVRFGADRVPLFRGFSQRELAAIARVSRDESAKAGQVLCHQGDVGHEFFLILEGEAVVRRNLEEINTLRPGDFFGELALLTRNPRNATVVAATDMALLVLGRSEFVKLIDSLPELVHKLLAGLAERLSEADARMVP